MRAGEGSPRIPFLHLLPLPFHRKALPYPYENHFGWLALVTLPRLLKGVLVSYHLRRTRVKGKKLPRRNIDPFQESGRLFPPICKWTANAVRVVFGGLLVWLC